MKKRILSLLLAAVMVFFVLPVSAFSAQIEVTIRFVNGDLRKITVDSADSVESLKEKLQQSENIPAEFQTLSYAGKRLEDGKTLEEYGITQGSPIMFSFVRQESDETAAAVTPGIVHKIGFDEEENPNTGLELSFLARFFQIIF